jgi:hypothetical protein
MKLQLDEQFKTIRFLDSQTKLFRHRLLTKMLCKGKDEDAILVFKLISILIN